MSTTMQPAAAQSSASGVGNMRWFVVVWLAIGMVIAYCDRVNLTVALPEMAKGISLDAEQQGMAMSAFFWTYTLFQIPAGMLVDRHGARTLYLIGFLIWSVGSALTTFTTGLASLIAFRLLVGMGEGVVTSSSLHYIRNHFVEKERGLAVGIYMTGTKIGPAIGLPLAAALVTALGWKPMFLIMGFGCLLWLGPWLLCVKSSDPAAKGTQRSTTGERKIGLFEALASPVMWGIILGTFCYMYFVYYCMTWMPQYFQKVHNMSLTKAAWFGFVSFGGMAAVAAFGGWWADRMIAGGKDPVMVRKMFTIAGFVLAAMQTASVFVKSEQLMIFFTVASLCGLGLATANYWALTQTLMPGALPVAIQNTAANLAGIVAPWLTGWIIKETGSFDAPIKVIGFWLMLGIGAYLVLVRRREAVR